MRALRERVFSEFPQHAHDLGLLRRLTIERALHESGDDPALASAAYAIFFQERNRVDFYPDAHDGLQRIAAHLPIAALTNGNAAIGRCAACSMKPAAGWAARPAKSCTSATIRTWTWPAPPTPACAAAGSTAATTPGRNRWRAPTCTFPP